MAGTIYDQLGLAAPPAYTPLYDPSSINAIPVDLSGISAYRQQAMRTGPSAWANLAKISNSAQEADQKEQGQKSVAGQTASAENQIASSGGLSSGARERAAEGGATNYLDMSQNLQRQGNLNDLQVGINDEQNRIQQLGALPGLESQAIQPLFQKANMTSQNNQALNSYNMNNWNQQNQAIAANNQANATANAGKK